MSDVINGAIAAAEAPERRAGVQIQLPTGRQVGLNVPADLSAQEAVALIGYIANGLPAELAKQGQRGPRLLVPTGVSLRSS